MELRERKQESLKEKLRAKYHERDFTPKEDHSDKLAMGFFFISFITLLCECLFVLIPNVFPDSWTWYVLMLVVFFEVIVNWHRTYFDVDNWVKNETKEPHFPESNNETPPNWRACFKCQVDAPPRSHHCKLCGKCMLKRDIHCFVTGSCIGYHNQKFYVMFCMWSAIGSALCAYMQLHYLNADIPLNSADFITYIPPVFLHRWIMTYITFGQLLLICHFYICVLTFIISILFFIWQVMVISQGLTSHEAWKRILRYQGKSLKENMDSVFGSVTYIPILIFIPIRFEQNGDGINWRLRRKGQ